MLELAPSNEDVQRRSEELEARLQRVIALAAAAQDMAAHLPDQVDATQSLLDLLNQEAPLAMAEALWLARAFRSRSSQIAASLRSVA